MGWWYGTWCQWNQGFVWESFRAKKEEHFGLLNSKYSLHWSAKIASDWISKSVWECRMKISKCSRRSRCRHGISESQTSKIPWRQLCQWLSANLNIIFKVASFKAVESNSHFFGWKNALRTFENFVLNKFSGKETSDLDSRYVRIKVRLI